MALWHLAPLVLAAATSASSILPRGDVGFVSLAGESRSHATPVSPRDEDAAGAGFLSVPIEHYRYSAPLRKRDANVQLFNISSVSYLVQLSIGTPGQNVKVAIDTGSDELWVDPKCTGGGLEKEQIKECQADGLYLPEKSSTANVTNQGTDIPYGKGEVIINYVLDNIGLPGSSATLQNVQFGVAKNSTELSEGIMGLGFGQGTNLNYNNFIDQLALQKVTNSRAFSVALGSVDANNGGVIIFGGVDTKKFSGNLVSNKILPPQARDVFRYWVQMTAVSLETNSTSKTYSGGNLPVVLDSGSSLSYLPASMVRSMAADFGGQKDPESGLYLVSCDLTSTSGSIDFAFGAVTIKVPFNEFIWEAAPNTCVLGVSPVDPTSGLTALLGDTFMRSAFVVFDQAQNTISMAQYVNCGQAEQSIPATGISGLQGQCAGTSSSPNKNAAERRGYLGSSLAVAVAVAALVHICF
ncbi:acid protease [Thozetella sp. PMI_491]|nr:acid protease [Thozetella sp. PMI_491]